MVIKWQKSTTTISIHLALRWVMVGNWNFFWLYPLGGYKWGLSKSYESFYFVHTGHHTKYPSSTSQNPSGVKQICWWVSTIILDIMPLNFSWPLQIIPRVHFQGLQWVAMSFGGIHWVPLRCLGLYRSSIGTPWSPDEWFLCFLDHCPALLDLHDTKAVPPSIACLFTSYHLKCPKTALFLLPMLHSVLKLCFSPFPPLPPLPWLNRNY